MSGLVMQSCDECGHLWWLTRTMCPRCGGGRPRDRTASGRAVLYARTRVHLTPDKDLELCLPFDIGLVDLAEGPRIMAHIEGRAEIGSHLQGGMAERGGRSLPVFMAEEDGP